jgi:hypothetical protein
VSLAHYLEESGSDLDDVYSNGRSWSDLRAGAKPGLGPPSAKRSKLRALKSRTSDAPAAASSTSTTGRESKPIAASSPPIPLPPCKGSRPHRHCEELTETQATKQSHSVPGCSPSGTPATALIYPLRKWRTPRDEENSIPPASCWENEDAATGWTNHHAHRVPSVSG